MAILQDKPENSTIAVKKLQRMAGKLASQFARNHRQDYEDLFQEAQYAIVQAFDRFDDSKGMAFSSFAHTYIRGRLQDVAGRNWKSYNNTSAKPVEDYQHIAAASESFDDVIDFQNRLARMDGLTRAIVKARQQGFSFREISEAATKLGTPMTLHQVRSKFIEAIAQ